jgi:DNA invertase Pin-like site-specific DNA recombinase
MAKSKTFGYARVSSDDQNEGRQIEALTAAGVDERYIFVDKESGRILTERNIKS